MSGDSSGASEQQQLERLRAILAQLDAGIQLDRHLLEELTRLARELASSDNTEIARHAQQLELKALAALLAHQAATMRQLALELQRIARMLPSAHPELN